MGLRELRKERGLTLEAAALMAGVHPTTLGRLELGKAAPAPQTVERLAQALGIAVSRMRSIILGEDL